MYKSVYRQHNKNIPYLNCKGNKSSSFNWTIWVVITLDERYGKCFIEVVKRLSFVLVLLVILIPTIIT